MSALFFFFILTVIKIGSHAETLNGRFLLKVKFTYLFEMILMILKKHSCVQHHYNQSSVVDACKCVDKMSKILFELLILIENQHCILKFIYD